jgi:signal recognition particle receptor subunit beta
VTYSSLPIRLGELGGVGTQIELIAVPGAAEQAMTRKQLLDEVDGIVLILDASPEQIEHNRPAIQELRESLAAYGRSLENFPVVLQYNKRDVADPFAIEDLHRRIGLEQAAVFETIATTGHGILATLTTISKHVVRARRGMSQELVAPAPVAEVTPSPSSGPELEMMETEPLLEAQPADALESSSHDILEAAILAEGEALDALERTHPPTPAAQSKPVAGRDLRIVSVGQARLEPDGGVRLPLVLGDEDGQSSSIVLSLRLDALLEGGSD